MNKAHIGKNVILNRCLVADEVRVPDNMKLGDKKSKEILLVSKALIQKAGEDNE